jgi:hypothetical protein
LKKLQWVDYIVQIYIRVNWRSYFVRGLFQPSIGQEYTQRMIGKIEIEITNYVRNCEDV